MKLTSSLRFLSCFLLGHALFAHAATGPEIVRIKAGVTAPLTDETGVVWRADTGFTDGDTIERSDAAISNTKTPSVYRSERYGMSAFHWKLANGKYRVKLHFAETYEGITAPGERVFDFNVEGHEFKGFDVFKLAGGALRAYVESVDVDVKDGSLDITFSSQVENPQINALEIIPAT
ncbi:MAG: malectin [Lacunisphaera sp.]